MDLREIGKRVIVKVTEDVSLTEAASLMRENHVGDVVVYRRRGGHNIPTGIVTDRDLVMATIALGAGTEGLAVGDLMTTNLATIPYDSEIGAVVKLMRERGVKRIPLVGEEGELLGIIALEDVAAYLARLAGDLAAVPGQQRTVELERRRKLA